MEKNKNFSILPRKIRRMVESGRAKTMVDTLTNQLSIRDKRGKQLYRIRLDDGTVNNLINGKA